MQAKERFAVSHISRKRARCRAPEQLARERSIVEVPAIATDAVRLQEALQAMEQAQSRLDDLYERWAELEAKNPG